MRYHALHHIPLLAKSMVLQVFYLHKKGFPKLKPYKLKQLEAEKLLSLHVGAALHGDFASATQCWHSVSMLLRGLRRGGASVGWGRRCLCMTAMCWPWCTHMTWRPSSLPARTPPSGCTGTTSGTRSLPCFSLCLSVPAFVCVLTSCCLASIVSACLLVCLASKRAFLAS